MELRKISIENTGSDGETYLAEYQDADSFEYLDPTRCKQSYGVCFTNEGKLVIGYGGKKKAWGAIGDRIIERALQLKIQLLDNQQAHESR